MRVRHLVAMFALGYGIANTRVAAGLYTVDGPGIEFATMVVVIGLTYGIALLTDFWKLAK